MSGIENFKQNSLQNGNLFDKNKQWMMPAATEPQPAAPAQAAPTQAVATPPAAQNVKAQPQLKNQTIRDEFVKIKKDNGLFRKFYNFLKNSTGFGLGSKAIEAQIDKFEQGQVSEDDVRKNIKQYQISQENALQTGGDIAAAAVTVGGFYKMKNFAAKNNARIELNAYNKFLRFGQEFLEEAINSYGRKHGKETNIDIKKALTMTNKKFYAITLPLLALAGGFTKLYFNKFERIGSKEYKADKHGKTKAEYKQEKKILKKQKRASNWKAFWTGAVSGLMAPVTFLAGGIAGVPIFVASTLGIKYATNKHEDKKSLAGFVKSFADNGVMNTAEVALLAIPSLRKANYSKVLGENLEKLKTKFKDVKLHNPEVGETKTAYQELEDMMLTNPKIKDIIDHSYYSNMEETVTKLIDENIFAAKFLQIKNNNLLGTKNKYAGLTDALKSSCPATRTMDEAQEFINGKFPGENYVVSKCLGVGTIAETYLAKGKDGKEVCIKILKKGMDAAKIQRDKEKFIAMVKNGVADDMLTEDQKYLIKNIENLADGISKEVDFVHEMNAANELRKYTSAAHVVKPIKAVDGAYIMEKADGISVKTLVEYYNCKARLTELGSNRFKGDEWAETQRSAIIAKMDEIKAKSPDFEDFDLDTKQIKKLLNQYMLVTTEQFNKVNKGEKVIHADIHPENIFVNLNALKTGKGKLFTLIDTGNTIKMSKEEAKHSLKLIALIKNGNTKDLTDVVLEGAVLPEGLSKADATKLIGDDLKDIFFNNSTKIDKMDIDSFYALSDRLLRNYGIIPNNTQLNLVKAKTSSNNSYEGLRNSFFKDKYTKKFTDLDDMLAEDRAAGKKSSTATGWEATRTLGAAGKDFAALALRKELYVWFRETMNLFNMSPKEAWNFIRNKNMLKTNSEDYLTYKFKQDMPGPNDGKDMFGGMFGAE